MIYNPDLVARTVEGELKNLAVESARCQADVPLLLAWPGSETPANVAQVQAQVPAVVLAPKDSAALVAAIHEMIAAARDSSPASDPVS